MERDFTDERKNEVREVIEASLLKWIQLDLQIESTSELVPELGLNVAIDCAEAYRERVIQKLQKSLEVLEEKYKDTNDIDKSYATNHIADAIKSIQSLNTYILRLAEALQPENGGMDAGKAISLNSMWNSYELAFEKIQQNSEFAYDVENIVYGIDGNRRNLEWVGMKQQEYVVEAYELIHPEIKEKMDKLLSTGEPNVLTSNDITSIKYLAYTAPEPYKTVYLEYVGKYEFACIYDDPMDRTSNYGKDKNQIYIYDSENALKNCSRGDYMTIFHESGHAIDYIFNANDTEYYCLEFTTYSDELGRDITLQEAIYFDVYNNIEEKIRLAGITDESAVSRILETFKYGQSDTDELDDIENRVREEVIDAYADELSGESNAAAGDVYGGVTNLVLDAPGVYGHRPKTGNVDEYRYWYNADGSMTYRQSKELWAEYFASCMTSDKPALESIEEHFPVAIKVLEAMSVEMKEEIYEE